MTLPSHCFEGRLTPARPHLRACWREAGQAAFSTGWGFGVGVTVRRTGLTRTVGSYGWDGGLGTSWANDPAERLIGVVLSTDMFAGNAALPHPLADFWTTVYAALP